MKELTLRQIAGWCGGTVAPEYASIVVSGMESDSRKIEVGDLFVALRGERVDGFDFIPSAKTLGAAAALVSRETEELPCILVPDTLKAYGAIARHYREETGVKVVGITGSVGKTTTKEMIAGVLARDFQLFKSEGNHNNDIGLPMTIMDMPENTELLVAEMGTNHPGEIAALCDIAEPDIGLLTGIGTTHLEFFGSRARIAEEKGTLLARAKDFSVYPAKDDFAAALSARAANAVPVAGLVEGLLDPARPYPPHFAENAALAFAVASRFGVTREQARAALDGLSLPGARWRLREKWGATFIDDTYNANPESMVAALDTLAVTPCDGKRVAVLGDMFELGPDALAYHRKVFDHAMRLKIPLVIGVGEQSAQCLCHCVYRELKTLKKKFRLDVSAGDLVLLKASHAMNLGSLLDD